MNGKEHDINSRLAIGLVIPSYNQGEFMGRALMSALSQDTISLELAVCDGGSTDATLAVVEQYGDRLAYFRSHSDRGQASAVNEGISHLPDTQFVGWLNADDVLLPSGLKVMAAELRRNSELVAVYGRAYVIDEHDNIVGTYPTKSLSARRLAIHCPICQPASLIRRSAWDDLGGLDESLRTCMDYEFWWRLMKRGKIGFVKEFVACTRDHPYTKTRSLRKTVHDEAVAVLLRHRGMVPRNWCMANILEGLEVPPLSGPVRLWRALRHYVEINGAKALLPQNWLFW